MCPRPQDQGAFLCVVDDSNEHMLSVWDCNRGTKLAEIKVSPGGLQRTTDGEAGVVGCRGSRLSRPSTSFLAGSPGAGLQPLGGCKVETTEVLTTGVWVTNRE